MGEEGGLSQRTPFICTSSKNGYISKLANSENSRTTELLRCQGRIDFTGLDYALPRNHPAEVARRNERERNRMKQVNQGFATLRKHVPQAAMDTKLSKLDILRSAIVYIRHLQRQLVAYDTFDAAVTIDVASDLQNVHSPACSIEGAHSPSASSSTDSTREDEISIEEEYLLSFTSWLKH